MLRAAGAAVDDSTPDVWVVQPGRLAGRAWDIEPDLSGAAPFLAAAVVTGGEVTVPGWPHRTTQAGDRLRTLLERMGASAPLPGGLTVRGTGAVRGIDVDLSDVSELTPVLAALCALADSPSRLTGIGHIRGHETDRLAALARELTGLGAEVVEAPDGLTIRPRPLRGGRFHTYDDHRMAHAAAVIGLVVPGSTHRRRLHGEDAAGVPGAMVDLGVGRRGGFGGWVDAGITTRTTYGFAPPAPRAAYPHRPRHEAAVEALVTAVDRGRYTCRTATPR